MAPMPGLAMRGGSFSAYCTRMSLPLVAERSEGLVIAIATASAGSPAAMAAAAAAASSADWCLALYAASASVSSPMARANAACAAATAGGFSSRTVPSSRR